MMSYLAHVINHGSVLETAIFCMGVGLLLAAITALGYGGD